MYTDITIKNRSFIVLTWQSESTYLFIFLQLPASYNLGCSGNSESLEEEVLLTQAVYI